MKKACVLGHFGFGKELLNGQTVKTKMVADELEARFPDGVQRMDSAGGLVTLFKSPFQIISAFKKAENLIILPASNGVRVYAPLISVIKKLFKGRRAHYVVIGGWLPGLLEKKRFTARALKRFDGIYVETAAMKKALEEQGFENVTVMPNCKRLRILLEDELTLSFEAPYKLCTFSRVMREKGIEHAVNAVKAVNEALGREVYSLDIYGQVDAGQTEWFDALQKELPSYISYRGAIPAEKSVDALKEYFALLFPTYYDGEGFAGTLIDAYSAGVPVVASDWKYNSEIVTDDTGYLYPTFEVERLVELLKKIADEPEVLIRKRALCLKEAEKYEIGKVVQILIDGIEGK